MSDSILRFYNRELNYIRDLANEFAQAYPKVAGRLRIGSDSVADPHVERLLQGFAYLTARIRQKLDDDFPELTEGLLQWLYPHYLSPFPSCSVIEYTLPNTQGELVGGYNIPSKTLVETEPIDGEPCRFSTNYPVKIWPFSITNAALRPPPFDAIDPSASIDPKAVLDIKCETLIKSIHMSKMENLNEFRFYLHSSSLGAMVYTLYEHLMKDCEEVVIANGPDDPNPVRFGPEIIQEYGFNEDQGLLPYPKQSHIGYRLITEYFCFPEKFLFINLAPLKKEVWERIGSTFHIYFYLKKSNADLERNLDKDTIRLGCTPIINLFEQRAEPINWDHSRSEYRIVPDARRPKAMEVHSVKKVSLSDKSNQDDSQIEVFPFFSPRSRTTQKSSDKDKVLYYSTSRKFVEERQDTSDQGTEVYMSLIDKDFDVEANKKNIIHIETLCLNRDLPARLPFGGGQPKLKSIGSGTLAKIQCLHAPTSTKRSHLKSNLDWKLLSHLSLNHLSITDGKKGAMALKEMLKLYDLQDTSSTNNAIEGIVSIDSSRTAGSIRVEDRMGFIQGMEIRLRLDEARFVGMGKYLFASILDRFFGEYCSLNSFTRLVVETVRTEGVFHRWPNRSGQRKLV